MTQIKATYIDHMGSDLTVVNAARVSFNKTSDWEYHLNGAGVELSAPYLGLADTKLIQYLAKHKHTSPFGHCFASFHVKAPVFVRAQLVKHKFLRLNEVSRRYVDEPPEVYIPDVIRSRPDTGIKQGSGSTHEQSDYWRIEMHNCAMYGLRTYNDMIADGVAPEMARMVLPQSMMTEWHWSGSLDAFADMCVLRLDPHAQLETRIVAEQIDKEMSHLFPVSWKALLG